MLVYSTPFGIQEGKKSIGVFHVRKNLKRFFREYETTFQILPKFSNTVIISGRAGDIRDVKKREVQKALQDVRAVYKKENVISFKSGFKVFLNNTFVYYEHFLASYDSSTEDIYNKLYTKKDLAERNLINILEYLGKKKGNTVTSVVLLNLDGEKTQEIVGIIGEHGGKEITVKDQNYAKFRFDIYASNDIVYLISTESWKNCHATIRSFIHSIRKEIPNPEGIINLSEFVENSFIKNIYESNILCVERLTQQSKTFLQKLIIPSFVIVTPLMALTLYAGLTTANILALSVYLMIIATLIWLWRSF